MESAVSAPTSFDNEAVLVLLGELSRRADNLVDEAASGEWLRTFAIITTNANELVADIHDRMPLILAPDDYARWLDQVITVYAQ
jgi:putative SOS response-associated peptidase YedK